MPRLASARLTEDSEQALWLSGGPKALTDEVNGLLEPDADLGHVVVLHGDALVQELPFKVVRAAGGHVEHRRDAQGLQDLPVGGVVAAAQVQKGQDLHGAPLQERQSKHLLDSSPGWGGSESQSQDLLPIRHLTIQGGRRSEGRGQVCSLRQKPIVGVASEKDSTVP